MAAAEPLVNKEGERIRGMFGEIAPRYDFLNRLFSLGVDQRWRAAAARLSGVQPGQRVLDVCCGTADLALAFGRRMQWRGRVMATDFTPQMLELAKRKVNGRNIQLGAADTLRLPFVDCSFDCCAVGFGIRNVQDLRAGVREMARVVRPGGRVVILEFTTPPNRLFRGLYNMYSRKIMPFFGNLISRSRQKAYSYLPNSVRQFPDAQGLREVMEQCGLADVQIHLRSFGIAAIHIGTKR